MLTSICCNMLSLGGEDVYVVPFVEIKSFHEEYLLYNAHHHTLPESVASLSTFAAAFKHLKETKGIKKLKAKGTFNTCEICNNASELLLNKRKETFYFILSIIIMSVIIIYDF